MFEEFVPPANAESDDYHPRDNYGHGCIVKVTEFKAQIQTKNGNADAVFADLYDLTDSQVYRNVMLMGGAFVDAFKPYVGKGPVVVVWEKRESKAGRVYAVPAPAGEQQKSAATAVMASGDPFVQAIQTIDAEPPF